MPDYDIDIDACRARQQRVVEVMQRHSLDLVVVTQNAHVQYLAPIWKTWWAYVLYAMATLLLLFTVVKVRTLMCWQPVPKLI